MTCSWEMKRRLPSAKQRCKRDARSEREDPKQAPAKSFKKERIKESEDHSVDRTWKRKWGISRDSLERGPYFRPTHVVLSLSLFSRLFWVLSLCSHRIMCCGSRRPRGEIVGYEIPVSHSPDGSMGRWEFPFNDTNFRMAPPIPNFWCPFEVLPSVEQIEPSGPHAVWGRHHE